MLKKLEAENHAQPFRGPFTITRVLPGGILGNKTADPAFGSLANIDHAVMKKGLTIKMHEHVNDEILSYVGSGVMHHKDSAGFEASIARGKLMMMNAGASFWHEEKVKDDEVEMLQIFVRPNETNLSSEIQFHDKPVDNRNWYVMVGPEGSEAPLYVRQNVYILDAHPKAGEELEVPTYDGHKPILYVMNGEITLQGLTIGKQEAVTDLVNPLPPLVANEDTTIVLFFVDRNAPMSMEGTISGLRQE
ncbi:redox-sensitive bicupin YhaK (pirin superfamily) [Virgibacillus natechei]|uniref:Redox-sensitive bicupin YhaK (Pirin superfamily) n=1 Tax=Virgibacillus natechei TaxID=1216297 RepID=A0ABS4IC49_9BACI|nr:pirin family protein [Virgibacillus natechei]MBP1968521.1 redox-sensitive bicupin YhaK (pirin superfamily) [Virgibacillus natechei]UZD13636.1 pirin family protein [Virgibacillus natechei]